MAFIKIAGQGFELSTPFSRLVAQWLDVLVLLILPLFVGGVLGWFGIRESYLGILMLIWIGFYLAFQDGINNGQSFGKRIMSMRVVNAETGEPCSYGKSIIRNLFIIPVFSLVVFFSLVVNSGFWIFLIVIPLVNMIDSLMIFGNKRQRLGDKLAKTLVVIGNPPKNGIPAAPPKPVKTFCVGVGILAGLVVVGYAVLERTPQNYESTDRLVQITAPLFWDQLSTSQINQDSTLEIYDSSGETAIQVITETKEELEEAGLTGLSQFAELTASELVSNLSAATVEDPIQITLNGYPAIQYEIQGNVDNDSFFYLHTSVEGKHHYHQVIGFTISEKKLSHKAKIQQILESFKELR